MTMTTVMIMTTAMTTATTTTTAMTIVMITTTAMTTVMIATTAMTTAMTLNTAMMAIAIVKTLTMLKLTRAGLNTPDETAVIMAMTVAVIPGGDGERLIKSYFGLALQLTNDNKQQKSMPLLRERAKTTFLYSL